jgi:hypothetical protein
MRRSIFAALAAIALMATSANAEDDPDLLKYPAPTLHPKQTGCLTMHSTTTITDLPTVSRICVGDTAIAQDYACPSVADQYHTDKHLDDTLEDMQRRQRKFGCKDITGLKLHIVEIYQDVGNVCGVDINHNKWCITVEGLEGTTATTLPNGKTVRQ